MSGAPDCLDFHTHIFPERIAPRAVASLGELYHAQPAGEATAAGLTAAMDAAGVTRSVLLPVATRPDQVRSINRWVCGLSRERFEPFGAVHPDCPDLEAELAYLRDQGVRGVKLQPHFQGYELAEASTLRMMGQLADMIVVIHAGQEMSPIPRVPTTPEALRALHERFPQHRLVVAHLGGFQMWSQAEEFLLGADVYLDLSFTFGHLDDATIARLVTGHGVGRVLFGSDYPWALPAYARAGVERLGLPPADAQSILAGNARRLLAPGPAAGREAASGSSH